MTVAFDSFDLDALELRISAWLADELETNPVVASVERGEQGRRRWYVRLNGEDKDVITMWLTLGQRTLVYETYVLPAPDGNQAAFFEYALRRNRSLVSLQFAIADEDALFLVGGLPITGFSEAELDRILGTTHAEVERSFRALVAIGFRRPVNK